MKKLLLNFLWLLIIVSAANAWSFTTEDCIRCHKNGSQSSKLHIDVEVYNSSIHGREIACQDCHTGVRNEEHETVKGSGTVDCSICHEEKNNHGPAGNLTRRPQCYSCHSKHAIFEKENELSTVYPGKLKKTCEACHPAESGSSDCLPKLISFRISSHKKGDFSCSYSKDQCLSCHQGRGAHGTEVLLNRDDCYKCHISLAGKPLLLGYIHPKDNMNKSPGIVAVAIIYLLVISLFFFGGFVFYCKKFSQVKKQPKGKNHC